MPLRAEDCARMCISDFRQQLRDLKEGCIAHFKEKLKENGHDVSDEAVNAFRSLLTESDGAIEAGLKASVSRKSEPILRRPLAVIPASSIVREIIRTRLADQRMNSKTILFDYANVLQLRDLDVTKKHNVLALSLCSSRISGVFKHSRTQYVYLLRHYVCVIISLFINTLVIKQVI